VKLLGDLGHSMIELKTFGIDWLPLYRAQANISGAMFAASMADWKQVTGREPAGNDLEPLAWAAYRGGQKVTGEQVAWGLQTLRMTTRKILRLWRGFDVLLTPTALTAASPIGHLDSINLEPREFQRRQGRAFGYTPTFNMTGQPSMSLPLGMSSDHLPIGMMFTGRYADEATLFRLAAQLENASPWRERKSPIFG